MIKRLTTAAVFLIFFAGVCLAQENPLTKEFKLFKDVAPGVDFYATAQSDFEAYVKPISDMRKDLAGFLGTELAPGAIFVCSKLAQKDSVYDQRVFKAGYKWFLIQLTAEAQREERQARMQNAGGQGGQGGRGGQDPTAQGGQAQAGQRGGQAQGGQAQAGQRGGQAQGGQAQAGQRGGQAQGGQAQGNAAQEARAAITLATQAGYATLMTTLNPDAPFRISRLDDMSKSPLVDWLDIGLVAQATNTWNANVKFLQDHLEDSFGIDDILSMNRPYVATQDTTGGGGGGRGGGGAAGGGRGGAAAVMPKDVLDRTLFDAQSATFFDYLIEKYGRDKATDIVRQNIEGVETLPLVEKSLGKKVEAIEIDWQGWLKAQK